MAISSRSKRFISSSNVSRLKTLCVNLQRLDTTVAADVETTQLGKEGNLDSGNSSSTSNNAVHSDMSSWRRVDSRLFGLDRGKISYSTLMTLDIIRRKGKKAYLVGGCVRDLLLHRIPKDFDVITDAKLKEIKKYFGRAQIIGQRFPICLVFLRGSTIEVSSFHTVAKDNDGKERAIVSQGPIGCNSEDLVRWQNCLNRDFTINSLLYDPHANKIYDYANGMRDLMLHKVQTVIPAHLSFKEDCARILRGLRIAARLGFSFSEETAAAIDNLYLSILDLSKARLMMEMDYMFSYGAAASSLFLLERFKILDLVLPFHAAYLSEKCNDQNARSPLMLFKLFSSMDKLFACGRPCNPVIWIGLLSFHLALVNNPQEALVIWAFTYVFLYNGTWKEAVKFAREKSKRHVGFSPEISLSCCTKTDKELAEDVNSFVSQVISSIDILIEQESLVHSMTRYPLYPCSGLVFISKLKGSAVANLFKVMLNNMEPSQTSRKNFEIDYRLVKKGDCKELRFVLGKIIMDTMSSGVVQDQQPEMNHLPPPTHLEKPHKAIKEENNSTLSSQFFEHQQVAEIKTNIVKRNKVAEKEKVHPSKMSDINVVPSTHPEQSPEAVKKEKSCSISSHLVQPNKMMEKKDSSRNSNTRKRQIVKEKENQSIPISSTNQNQQVVKKDDHHQLESNQEQRPAAKKRDTLSSLFK